jgi:uncharacterized protein YbjT (DUF2867 family)
MHIVIAGGHGQIALLLTEILSGRGDTVTGIVRNPAHIPDVEEAGGLPALCDLEHADVDDLAVVMRGADAAVFAAGAGPGGGAARKDTVDRAAAVLFADAAERTGVPRLLQISSMGAGAPPDPGRGDVWVAYIDAKTRAEEDLRRRGLDWVILRPGRLTDDRPTGTVRLAEPPAGRDAIARGDVAAVCAALLAESAVSRTTLEVVGGPTPVHEAVAALVADAA